MLVLLLAAGLAAVGFREVAKARCFAVAGPIVCRVDTDEKTVALSFDDGPTWVGVETVLPLLERYGATATFFVVGRAVEQSPELTRAIAEAGHEIGNHSYAHPLMIGFDEAEYRTQLEKTDRVIEAAGLPKPRWMRPPYGAKFVGLGRAVAANDQIMVMWDVEEPYHATTPEHYARELLEQVKPGSIILVHPMMRSRDLEREALPLVLEGLTARGYEIVSVGELVEAQ